MSYLKNKITETRDELDVFDRFEFEMACQEELKVHPQELGPLINMATRVRLEYRFSPIKHFEFYPDLLFECIKLKTLSFEQFKEQKELLKGGCFFS